MNKVKSKKGRPRRSDAEVDLRSIGERIRKLRGQTTQEQFAKQLGISQAQLSKYELGQSAPPLGLLAKLRHVSGKTVDWVLRGTD